MFASKKMKKILAISATAASLLCYALPSYGQVVGPTSDATAVDNTHFGGIVALQCALVTASPSTGNTAGTGTVTPYTATTANGDPDLDAGDTVNAETPGAPEPRVTRLAANETSGFNCNSDTVNLTVGLAVISPVRDAFNNAVDFNYTDDPTNGGLMNHLVDLDFARANVDTSVNSAAGDFAGFDGTTAVNEADTAMASDPAFAPDDQGNFSITITSTFSTTAEELGAGSYETVFVTTAVAQ